MRWRSLLLQALALVVVAGLIGILIRNTALNLEARGIASGFGFLSQPAGFDLAFHLLPYDQTTTFGQVFIIALLNTLLVSLIGVVMATIIGLIVALARLSSNPIIRLLGTTYVETLRNIPLLLQLFFWYFAVLRNLPGPRDSLEFFGFAYLNNRGLSIPFPVEPVAAVYIALALVVGLALGHFARQAADRQRVERGRFPAWYPVPYALPLLFPLVTLLFLGQSWDISWPELQGFNFSGGLQLIPEFVSLVVALSLYTAAFVAEIVRAGILSVQKGQMEAAQALGLSRWNSMRLIILPQALRVILPPLTSQYLNLVKNSSLAAAIAFPDLVLVFSGTAINITGQAVEIMAMVMLVYLVLSLSISAVMNRYQRKTLHYLGQRS
ncbi:MAG TPA: ABC transporter permease subunit [Oligoflexus sp.]|uniref:amino acid ABC transporter permease n=1 Tax=Oligoflexus sp. TaxID=1971216 RepID=UPI002D2E93FA|nr:ABC transporter permease subunit [Oligoflexus sp.]HYX35569.1 ABC transporter permease subunit [Oligoflexus sp.]